MQTFLYIRSEPTTESEWLGKLYPGNAARILGPVGEWTKIQSGQVTGYVYSDYIIIGKNAEEKAREVGEEAFVYAESKAEEEARLKKEAEEAAQKAAEEAAAKAGTGQAIVDYACQFIGNPYVWGGTSLTEGADCSGFGPVRLCPLWHQSSENHLGYGKCGARRSATTRLWPATSFCMTAT